MALKTIKIPVLINNTRLKAFFDFFIDCCLHNLIETRCTVLLLYFDLEKKFKAFSK